jgi:uncharacterized protein YwqG
MNAIKLNFSKSNNDLFGQSKWWGAPDLPEDWEYPCVSIDDETEIPLTFICQIRCSDIAKYDTKNLLPHEGMLYFFAALGEYMEKQEDFCEEHEYYNGIGEWSNEAFKVLYAPTTNNLSSYEILYDDGSPTFLPAEALTFGKDDESTYWLLGGTLDPEVGEQFQDYINLLQVDENPEDWGLCLYDMGTLNFLIKPKDLMERKFDKALVYFQSC